MPLRSLLRYLANNEQLIQRLADSYPIRKVARFCIRAFYRTQDAARENLPPINTLNPGWFRSFVERFKNNLSEEMKNAQRQLKDKDSKR